MSIVLADALRSFFEPVKPMEFYREIFPDGALAPCSDAPQHEQNSATHGYNYVGIAVEITPAVRSDGRPIVNRYSICDELDELDKLMYSNNFCIVAPISYVGKTRESKNARFMYALCIEVDNLIVDKRTNEQNGLLNLIKMWSAGEHAYLPQPTFTVASGSGLHLYYQFEKPVPLFPNVVDGLKNCKRELTRKIWNRKVTTSYNEEDIQFESVFQAFRLVGGVTKSGERTEAFRTGEPVTLEYLNKFVQPKNQVNEVYQSALTLSDAKRKYPDWYERRIVKGEPKKSWVCKRAVYDWWKREVMFKGSIGHRYYCLMMLCIFAIKCDIDRDELEQDCFELMTILDELDFKGDSPFTEKDVMDALQAYEDKSLVTYPVSSISNRTGIAIEKNKRYKGNQKLSRSDNMKLRAMRERDIIYPDGEWRRGNGRKSAERTVWQWQQEHPYGRKCDCIRDTGLDKKTVYKWWDPMP